MTSLDSVTLRNDLRAKITTEAALRRFIESGEAKENFFCDFKGGIPDVRTDSHKKEEDKPYYGFCKSLCAFANSRGGFLVIGVQDVTLEVMGCTTLANPDDRVEDLKSQVNAKPDAKIIASYELVDSEKRVYVLEIFPSGSFRKPHFFRGKIFFRVEDAARCKFVDSPEQLSEEIKSDCFHKGSALSFKRFVEALKTSPTKLSFPYVDYFVAVCEFLDKRLQDGSTDERIKFAISQRLRLQQTIAEYKKSTSFLASEGGIEVPTTSFIDVNDSIDSFATAFLAVLDGEVAHG